MQALAPAWNEFWLAWTFLTRLPAPVPVAYSEQGLNRAARFFPAVGAVLGIMCALVFWLTLQLLGSAWLAVLAQTVAGMLLTGAFHEDGFADYCDSFGGQDVQSRLAIMTDSRLGTFGVAGLFSILALRGSLLVSLPLNSIPAAIIFAAVASRLLAVSIMVDSDYVKAQGKSKPLATTMAWPGLLLSSLPLLPLLIWLPLAGFILCAGLLLLFRLAFVYQLRQRLGGYTGDSLGAAQQVSEVLIYVTLLAVFVRFG
ncbi:MAG: adenosylcobinamide-GDP ribazoletransferase [Bermanella sp.]|jgi:adenosylcobinamide-GDP ribazoletransferase